MIEINDKNVLLFTDFHWGKSRDIEIKLLANSNFIDWLIKQAKLRHITTIIFMGDWHDNRNAISVKTYNYSYNSLIRMSEAGLTVHMLVGNHDAYYKDNIETNSLSAFNNIKNIYVYDKYTELISTRYNKKMAFFPWDTFNPDLVRVDHRYDCIFGHFEFAGAEFNNIMMCKHGYSGESLTNLSPLCFTGHFHLRKEYDYLNGKIVAIGCPLEHDWGDYGNTKGIYQLHMDTLKYDFIENDVSPRHNKIFWSDVKKKTTTPKEMKELVKGHYVKLIIDDDYKFESIIKVTNILNNLGPLKPCDTEFKLTSQFNMMATSLDDDSEDMKTLQMTKLDYLFKFVEKTNPDMIKELEHHKLSELIKSYYILANEKVEE